ncbi:TonB family protein [Sodalis sp. RH21]|uniref:TonB family protein n=1 Tax=unclassified Sodalis (in: enterobacteria) TaxID=2636512 RepID=UPI0039B5013D
MIKPLFIIAILLVTACSTPNSNPIAPKQLVKSAPAYPAYAAANRIDGYVDIEYDIGPDGKVSELRLIDSKPQYLFDDTVVIAVSKWRFETGKPYHNLKKRFKFHVTEKI